MYSKLFTKILDSSIWLESETTRIVWITLLAAMDRDGFCAFASPVNVAHRARVPIELANSAIEMLEAPDRYSSDPDNDGRRVERVPGGWIVLNAIKYREIATAEHAREKGAERVRQHRERKKTPCNAEDSSRNARSVTCNAEIVEGNALVNQADAATDTEAGEKVSAALLSGVDEIFEFYTTTFGRAKSYTLTDKRRKACRLRLQDQMSKGHTAEEAIGSAKQAIENLSQSLWHRENGHTDWLDQIFRSPEEFEKRLNQTQSKSAMPRFGHAKYATADLGVLDA